MKHGIISDIHANPTALAAVLADGEKEGVGRWVCCGDATGYGYDAPSCVDMVTTYFIYDDVRRRVIYRELPFGFKRYILDMIDRDVALPEWLLRILLAAR